MYDWENIADQLQRVANGENNAWDKLIIALHPLLDALVQRQPIGRLRGDEDAKRDIVTKVIGKLHRDEHRVITKFVTHENPPPIKAWIRIMVRSAAIDVMRGHPEFQRNYENQLPGWFSLATLVTVDGAARPDSLQAKQREAEWFMTKAVESARNAIAEHDDGAAAELARVWNVGVVHTRRLIKRIDCYPSVFAMILEGHTYGEIASVLALSRREIELTVRYIEEFYRARGFAS